MRTENVTAVTPIGELLSICADLLAGTGIALKPVTMRNNQKNETKTGAFTITREFSEYALANGAFHVVHTKTGVGIGRFETWAQANKEARERTTWELFAQVHGKEELLESLRDGREICIFTVAP